MKDRDYLFFFGVAASIVSASAYIWRDVYINEDIRVALIYILFPGFGLWNLHRFAKHKSMRFGFLSSNPGDHGIEALLVFIAFSLILAPLLYGIAA